MGFAKVSDEILRSSIMDESVETRWLWIVILTLADRNGNFRATATSLARIAALPLDSVEATLEILQNPDARSTTPDEEGRRIIQTGENQWSIVNYKRYRDLRDPELERENARERKRRQRERERMESDRHGSSQDVTRGHTPSRESHDIAECRVQSAECREDPNGSLPLDGASGEQSSDPPPKPRKRTKAKEPDPGKQLLDHYFSEYVNAHPCLDCGADGIVNGYICERCQGLGYFKPHISGGKDVKILRELLSGDRPLEQAKWIITQFFEDPPEWFAEKNLTDPKHIVSAANQILQRKSPGKKRSKNPADVGQMDGAAADAMRKEWREQCERLGAAIKSALATIREGKTNEELIGALKEYGINAHKAASQLSPAEGFEFLAQAEENALAKIAYLLSLDGDGIKRLDAAREALGLPRAGYA